MIDTNTKEYQFHSLIEELIVGDKVPVGYCLSFPEVRTVPHLRVLEIGNDCFRIASDLILTGMECLERVVIGSKCFTAGIYQNEFRLTDCPKLKELTIGRNSFPFYRSCVIENTPSLESIVIGTIQGSRIDGSFGKDSLELRSEFSDKW